jgi:ATP-dependent RNA helicase RhlE
MQFADLPLAPVLLKALAEKGYDTPTPIQQQAIPPISEGDDLVAIAQTGTGKTAAFALPTLQWLYENPLPGKPKKKPIRCLVLSPTRELASQIGDGFRAYGKGTGLTCEVIFGGVNQNPQVRMLKTGVDILVATPGRLLDLMGQGHLSFDDVEVFVLDEADRMLDMGFIHDVKRVMERLPEDRQTLLFSATMPDDITKLAQRYLVDPVRVEVTPPATTVEKISQSVFHVDKVNKRRLLVHLLSDPDIESALVFSRTKHGANRIAETLDREGIPAAAIHGNKSQGARERALKGFKDGKLRVLVATDIAARGIDIEGISHVIQADLPEVADQYVHRIGRTARAGRDGVAMAFCAPEEKPLLKQIEKTIRMSIDVVDDHPFPSSGVPAPPGERERRPPRGQGGGRGGQGRGGGGGRGGPSKAAAGGEGAGTKKKRPRRRRAGGGRRGGGGGGSAS